MKTSLRLQIPAVVFLLATSCVHIPPGGVKDAGVEFGIQPIFSVEKNVKNIAATEKRIRVGDTDTHVKILNFFWNSYAKGIELENPSRLSK